MQNVARPHGIAGNAVLDRRNQHAQPDFQAGLHDHPRQAEHRRGAAHVLLHQGHGAARLEVQPAGVETDPLADQRHPGMGGIAPAQIDQSWRLGGGTPDGVDRREILVDQFLSDDDTAFGAEFHGQGIGRRSQFGRPHIGRRGVDEVARQPRALCCRDGPDTVGAFRPDEPAIAPIVRPVAREPVTAQRPPQRRAAGRSRRGGRPDSVNAGGQRGGGAAPGPDVLLVRHADKGAADRLVGPGQQQHAAGRSTVAGSVDEGRQSALQRRLVLGQCIARYRQQRHCRRTAVLDQTLNRHAASLQTWKVSEKFEAMFVAGDGRRSNAAGARG